MGYIKMMNWDPVKFLKPESLYVCMDSILCYLHVSCHSIYTFQDDWNTLQIDFNPPIILYNLSLNFETVKQ
jgi:hypothetical protein